MAAELRVAKQPSSYHELNIDWHLLIKLIWTRVKYNREYFSSRELRLCAGGGTGRRARLRGVWGNPCGFKSHLAHLMCLKAESLVQRMRKEWEKT